MAETTLEKLERFRAQLDSLPGRTIINALDQLNIALHAAEKNFDTMYGVIISYKSKDAKFWDAAASMPEEEFVREFTRLLHNYLSSTEALVECARELALGACDDELAASYCALEKKLLGTPSVAFMQHLHKHIIRRRLPIEAATDEGAASGPETEVGGAEKGVKEPEGAKEEGGKYKDTPKKNASEAAVNKNTKYPVAGSAAAAPAAVLPPKTTQPLLLSKAGLEDWGGWSGAAGDYLAAQDNLIDLDSLCIIHRELMKEFQGEFYKKFTEAHSKELKEYTSTVLGTIDAIQEADKKARDDDAKKR